jgi:lipopolysaccharide heptosyltransferase I
MPEKSMKKPMRILIIKPSSLGDIIHSLPVAVALRRIYPESYIAWLVFDRFADILAGNTYIDKIIVWERKNTSISYLAGLVTRLRSEKFDLVIDLQGLARTAIVSVLTGAKTKLGVPGMKELSFLLVKEIGRFDKTEHAVDRNLRVVEHLMNDTKLNDRANLIKFPVMTTADDESFVNRLLAEHNQPYKAIAGILPAAGIPQKMWPAENFARVCDYLVTNHGMLVVLLGSKSDHAASDKICSLMKTTNHINMCGKTTLKQLAVILSKCKLVIGNDTGPLHLAAGLGIPVIGFYGPSNPDQLRSYSANSVYFYKKTECSPCGINPRCKTNKCLTSITTDEIIDCIRTKFLV